MRNSTKKWQMRARKYLTLLTTHPEAAKAYRLNFWKGDKFDQAVGHEIAEPELNQRPVAKQMPLRTDGKATVRRGDSAARPDKA